MPKCRITVLRKDFDQDLVDEYCQPGQLPCSHFSVGQEFIVDTHPGDGFCDVAWNDIYKSYATLMRGGSFSPWMKDDDKLIVCCSDAIRPVTFKLERIED